jgi:hypothetical protein
MPANVDCRGSSRDDEMTPFEHLAAMFPSAEFRAAQRMISEETLYDGKSHTLRDGMSREEARAVLVLAIKSSHDCGLNLVLSRDEEELMKRKFAKGSQ